MSYTVAIIGATGSVGREILNILSERQFPADNVIALASEDSIGVELEYGAKGMVKTGSLKNFDFAGVDIAFFAAGAAVSKKFVPKATKAGAIVIDNSSLFRMDKNVPLIVPEVNAGDLAGFRAKNIIANPNCSIAQLSVALNPLHVAATISRVVVATYQSVSGAGKAAMDELFNQTRAIFASEVLPPKVLQKQIAFNLIPKVGDFDDEGNSEEETKMTNELGKILGPAVKLTATCVRVPVFIGHSEAVNVEFEKPITPAEAREILIKAPGIILGDEKKADDYTTPVDCIGEYATYVSRIRKDKTVENGLNFWVVSDNLRKGAALNAVQIAELLITKHIS